MLPNSQAAKPAQGCDPTARLPTPAAGRGNAGPGTRATTGTAALNSESIRLPSQGRFPDTRQTSLCWLLPHAPAGTCSSPQLSAE